MEVSNEVSLVNWIPSYVLNIVYYRTDGEGELYTYLPLTDENAAAHLTVPPLTVENTDYGFSVGRGSFNFTAGEWFTITERILLNDPDSYNGQVRIWINGQSVIELEGVSMRNSSGLCCNGYAFPEHSSAVSVK